MQPQWMLIMRAELLGHTVANMRNGSGLLVSLGVGLAIIALIDGCAGVHESPSSDLNREQAQIEHRLNQIFEAAQQKRFDELESYHFYGPHFTKFAGSSGVRLDAVSARKAEHDGLQATEDLRMEAQNLKIDVLDRTAVATFILDYSFRSGAGRVEKKDRATLIFVKQPDGWKIVHEHLSPVQ